MHGSCAWTMAKAENVNQACAILNSVLVKGMWRWQIFKSAVKYLCAQKTKHDCPSYIMNLLTWHTDTRSVTRARSYGMYNLVCPHYNRETEGGILFMIVGLSSGKRFHLMYERQKPLMSLTWNCSNFTSSLFSLISKMYS